MTARTVRGAPATPIETDGAGYVRGARCPKTHGGNLRYAQGGRDWYECQGCGEIVYASEIRRLLEEGEVVSSGIAYDWWDRESLARGAGRKSPRGREVSDGSLESVPC